MTQLINMTTLPRFARNHMLLLLTLLMTAAFGFTGYMKASMHWMMIMAFDGYGLPITFMVFLGYAELFGAASLWLKDWALLGALGLTAILLGASAIHLANGDPLAIAGMAYVMTPITIVIALYHWSAAGREQSGRPRAA